MDETPTTPKKSNSWKWLLGGLGVFVIFATAFSWHLHSRKYVWTNDAYLDGYQIQISADIEARIITLFFDEGDMVKKGDLICQLDESILDSQRADALTNVELLEQSVKLQKIEMEKLHDIYSVAKQEYENEIISYIAFDKIEKDFQLTIAALKVAEAGLINGIAKLGVVDELLQHTKIIAPRDGAISKRWVVAGDVATIGEPLFSLTDVINIWVTANFEETKVGKIRPGAEVEIHIDAYPDREFTGRVFEVLASAASKFSLIPPDNATGNFTKVVQRVPVKILLDIPNTKPPLYLYPGMSTEIYVSVK